MKRFLLLLAPVLALALAGSPSVAQTVNLFDWSQGNVVAKQEFVTFDDAENRVSIPAGVTVQTYREYKITSPDGKTDYTLRLRGTDKTFDANGCYDGFSITDNTGRELLFRLGRDPLCHVNYLDMDTSKKDYFIQVPLDDKSFALIFGGWLFQHDDGAVEMIIVVVSKDKATVVFDGDAFAYKYTAPPNFSMAFTDDVYGLLDSEGKYTITEAALKPHNKYKIWREGNLLKYKRWK